MAMLLQCDNCTVTTTDTDANWLTLRRRGDSVIRLPGMGSSDPDPVLGRYGLTFHDYDCLRLWLMAHELAK